MLVYLSDECLIYHLETNHERMVVAVIRDSAKGYHTIRSVSGGREVRR